MNGCFVRLTASNANERCEASRVCLFAQSKTETKKEGKGMEMTEWKETPVEAKNRVLDTILYSAFGLIGCLVAFLIFVSEHEATSPNWLLAWVNPLCFLGAVLPWIKSAKKTLICYHFANFAVLILLLLCREYTGQVFNQAFIPLILTDLTRSGAVIYICRKN